MLLTHHQIEGNQEKNRIEGEREGEEGAGRLAVAPDPPLSYPDLTGDPSLLSNDDADLLHFLVSNLKINLKIDPR